MVREHTQIESNLGAPPPDTSQDGISLAAADAWDPRGAFEKAPVFTKEALVAEQTKRAQEGRPLLGRFVLEAPSGNSDAPVDYAKATMRALRNALGRDIDHAVVTGGKKAYVTVLDDQQGTEYASRPGGDGGGGAGGGGGDDNDFSSPKVQGMHVEQSGYQVLLRYLDVPSITDQLKKNAEEEVFIEYFNLPENYTGEELAEAYGTSVQEAMGPVPPDATEKQKAEILLAARTKIAVDLQDLTRPALARQFGLSEGATLVEIETEITKQYREEATEVLGLHPSATMEEINEEFMRQQREGRVN